MQLTTFAAHWHGHHSQAYNGPATFLGGTAPQWLTLGATIAALWWAVFLYRRSVADKRVETPRLVYAIPVGTGKLMDFDDNDLVQELTLPDSPGATHYAMWDRESPLFEAGEHGNPVPVEPLSRLLVSVRNDSLEVITQVETSLVYPGGDVPIRDTKGPLIEYMGPRSEYQVVLYARRRESNVVFPAVWFTDGAGRRWSHQAGEPVRLLPEWRNGRPTVWKHIRIALVSIVQILRRVLNYLRP